MPQLTAASAVLVLLAFVAGGCGTPVGVERADPQSVHRELTGNVLSTGERSDLTQNPLRSATSPMIAVRGDGLVEDGSDGVVRYQSAHIEGVESELIVRSGHSVQANPHTVLEVRRILLLHAEEACREEGIGCAEPATVAAQAQ